LDFDLEKVLSANHAQLKFQAATHLLCPGWVSRITKWQMFATGIFKTEFVIFG